MPSVTIEVLNNRDDPLFSFAMFVIMLGHPHICELQLLEEAIPTTGNAQSLLLCCWHSMKEISLLFGYLAEHAPVEVDQAESGVLTLEQVCCAGGSYLFCNCTETCVLICDWNTNCRYSFPVYVINS